VNDFVWLGRNHPMLSVILTIPHSGELVPESAAWLRGVPAATLLTDVDRFVHQLYQPATEELHLPALVTLIHRYVADLISDSVRRIGKHQITTFFAHKQRPRIRRSGVPTNQPMRAQLVDFAQPGDGFSGWFRGVVIVCGWLHGRVCEDGGQIIHVLPEPGEVDLLLLQVVQDFRQHFGIVLNSGHRRYPVVGQALCFRNQAGGELHRTDRDQPLAVGIRVYSGGGILRVLGAEEVQ
jgi:hypothetical protein